MASTEWLEHIQQAKKTKIFYVFIFLRKKGEGGKKCVPLRDSRQHLVVHTYVFAGKARLVFFYAKY